MESPLWTEGASPWPHEREAPVPWTTAHGDLHYANLCGPDLCMLDWECWGPPWRATTPPCSTVTACTPAGRFAELVAISELLHATTTPSPWPSHFGQRAAILLERAVPSGY